MSEKFKSSLDQELSGVVFTERMQQNVLRRIRAGEAAPSPQKTGGIRRFMLAAAAVTAFIFVVSVARLGGFTPGGAGDPINKPPDVAAQGDFIPVVTEAPQALTSYPVAAAEDTEPSAAPLTAEPTDTPTAEPTTTPTGEPTATPTAEPTATPELSSMTDLAPLTAIAAPTFTPAPVVTPDPASIVYEDDCIVVTMTGNQYDAVIATQRFLVFAKDSSRYALVTDAAQAPADGREALLLEDTVTDIYVYSHKASYVSSFTNTCTRLADNTVEVVSSGFLESSSYTAFHEFTYSTPDMRENIAYFSTTFPAGTAPRRSLTLSAAEKPDQFSLHSGVALWHADYSYVCIRFRYGSSLLRNAELRLVAVNGMPGDYGTVPIEKIGEAADSTFMAARIRTNLLPEDASTFTFEVWSTTRNTQTFTFTLVPEDTFTPTSTPTPEPGATPAPTPTPDPAKIVFEDERLVVTMEECVNDMFYVFQTVRVAAKDTSRYVLAVPGESLPYDGREVILVNPRMECLTSNVASGLKSFDLQDTDSASFRLYSQLEQSVYHMTCFDVDTTRQSDGSLLIRGVGDACEMQNAYDDGMSLLTALTITDASGQTGRTEAIWRDLPDSVNIRNVTYRAVESPDAYQSVGAGLYYREGYAYLSVKFNYDGELPGDTIFRVTAMDNVPGAYGEGVIVHREDEFIYYPDQYPDLRTAAYEHAVIRIDGIARSDNPNYFALEAVSGGETLFTVTLASQRVGDQNGPTPTPAGLPAFTPAPSADPSVASDVPAQTLVIPEGMTVLLQTDWITVLRGEGWFDGLMAQCSILVLPNDPTRYVLTADGVSADPQGRTVLPFDLAVNAYKANANGQLLARMDSVVTPAAQGGLQYDFSAFPLVSSGSLLYLTGNARLTLPSGAEQVNVCVCQMNKSTNTYQLHLQKPRTGAQGVSIVQGALYVTDYHCYVRFTYDKRTSVASPLEFHALKINGDPVTTYGLATTEHSNHEGYLISWGIVDYFTRSESPTTTIKVIDPATGESLGTFTCQKPENGYW